MKVKIVFDGPPGPEAGRYVETENLDGVSVRAGEWEPYGDPAHPDWWALVLDVERRSAHSVANRLRDSGYADLLSALDIVQLTDLVKFIRGES